MVSRLSKTGVFLGLTLACSVAWAGIFTPAPFDRSLVHLYQLFGAVGNQLGPNVQGRQLLGTLIRWLNLGLLSFVSLIITYTIIMGVIKTAQEGALMGREGKSGMTVIRATLGIALLVPGSTGYSLIQVFIMWVVIQGVGLADNIWVAGSSYMGRYGGTIFSTKTSMPTDSAKEMTMKISLPESMVPVALSAATSQMCVRYINDTLQQVTRDAQNCYTLATMKKAVKTPSVLGVDNKLALCQRLAVPLFGGSYTLGDAMTLTPSQERLVRNKAGRLAAAMTRLPHLRMYKVTRGTSPAYSIWTQAASGSQTHLYAAYGVKNGRTSVIPVCGAYDLGAVSSADSDTARYGAFDALHRAMMLPSMMLFDQSFQSSFKPDITISDDNFSTWIASSNTTLKAQWAIAVQRAINAWRTVISPQIQGQGSSAIADIPTGTWASKEGEGWMYAGGYYYEFSQASGAAMSSLQDVAKNHALCSYNSGSPPSSNTSAPASIAEVNASSTLSYPMNCSATASTPLHDCRRSWSLPASLNDVSNGQPTSLCAYAAGSTQETNAVGKPWDPSSLDLLGDTSTISLNTDVKKVIRAQMQLSGQDFWYQLTKRIPAKFGPIKTKALSEARKADARSRAEELASRRKVDTGVSAFETQRENVRQNATGIFFVNLAAQAVISTTIVAAAGAGLGAIMIGMTWAVIMSSASAWTALLHSGDPIYNMIVMGQVMGAMALAAWLSIGAIGSLTAMLGGTMNSMHGVTEGMKIALNWLAPLFQLVLTVSLANAGMLSVYIPMIPLMIYLFATLGWMITVLEAIIAGPLIAMGITHPQGQDLLGKSEQAMMMLISVFLRPALITIGFFASILFVRIAFDVFLGTITHYLFLAMTAHSVNMIIGLTFLTVYTIVAIGVIEVAFSLINVIPERVMHWIGVQGMAQDHSRQTMQMAQSGSRGVGEAAGRALGAGFSGMSQAHGDAPPENGSDVKPTTST